jgi:putative restriction endonuclease
VTLVPANPFHNTNNHVTPIIRSIMKDYTYYSDLFSHLHTAHREGKPAPHKPLLLLAVMDLIEQGHLRDNHIQLSDPLLRAFDHNVQRYVGHSPLFRPNIGQPYYHLQYEPFWRLVAPANARSTSEPTLDYGPKKVSYTLSTLRTQYAYAEIDPELFHLLQNADQRAKLRVQLISEYLRVGE